MLVHASFLGHRIKECGFYAGRSAQSPEHARQPKNELAFHGRFGVVVRNHRSLEGLVILRVLECSNDGLGREPMAYSIAA